MSANNNILSLPPEVLQQLPVIQDPPSSALLAAEKAFNGGVRAMPENACDYIPLVLPDSSPAPYGGRNRTMTIYAAWHATRQSHRREYDPNCMPDESNQSAPRTSLFTDTERRWLKNRATGIVTGEMMEPVFSEVATADLLTVQTNVATRLAGVLAGFVAIPRMLATARFLQQRNIILQTPFREDSSLALQQINKIDWEWPVPDIFAASGHDVMQRADLVQTRAASAARVKLSRAVAALFAEVVALSLKHDPDRLYIPVEQINPTELRSPFLTNSPKDFRQALDCSDNPAARLDEFYRGEPLG